jgi:hypothetical protein
VIFGDEIALLDVQEWLESLDEAKFGPSARVPGATRATVEIQLHSGEIVLQLGYLRNLLPSPEPLVIATGTQKYVCTYMTDFPQPAPLQG